MINKISFKNYKLFKEKQTLEIKPITILIGKNNSGKSAVLKLPTLISGSLEGKFSAPFQLENNGVRIGISYDDLFYNKEITGEALEFEIEDEKDNLNIFISGDRKFDVNISKLKFNKVDIDISKIDFNGFLTKSKKFKMPKWKINFDYIYSFRKFPDPQFSDIFSEYTKIGTDGENAYKLLAQYYKDQNPILEEIQNWFMHNFENWKLDVKDLSSSSPSYEIVLTTRDIKPINIVNTGSGIRQSLPLIVRSFMAIEEETLIIIEEPETHLHPAAHGNLAERFVQSYIENNKRKYLIETHSKNFILRLQALLADSNVNFTKNDIAIYYVDYVENKQFSTLEKLELDELGEFNKWPEEIFNESYRELLLLKQNQSERDDSIN